MVKRCLLAMTLVLALALPATAADVTGFYGGVKFLDSLQDTGKIKSGGMFSNSSISRNTVGGGVFLGYDFFHQNDTPVRAEVEYALRNSASKNWGESWTAYGGKYNATQKATWTVHTLMANFYFDIHNSTSFTPYLGAGLGMGFINNSVKGTYAITEAGGNEFSSGSTDQTNTVFAWNVGAGCAYSFTDNVAADLGYRFVGLGDNQVKTNGIKTTTSPYMNEFSLGLRFTF